MLIDLHSHTSGISHCCRAAAPRILEEAKNVGLDGIVLTNHYHFGYIKNMTPYEFAEKYVNEYFYTKALGDEMSFKVFFGIELTLEKHEGAHALIYGVDTDFALKYPDMYNLTLKELYPLVHAHGGVIVHAHPYRHGKDVLDTNYLDGVEVNCHGNYDATHSERLYEIAKANSIMLTCGGDYHADNYRPMCGTYLPDEIQNESDIAKFILTAKKVKLRVHELREPTYFEKEYTVR